MNASPLLVMPNDGGAVHLTVKGFYFWTFLYFNNPAIGY